MGCLECEGVAARKVIGIGSIGEGGTWNVHFGRRARGLWVLSCSLTLAWLRDGNVGI